MFFQIIKFRNKRCQLNMWRKYTLRDIQSHRELQTVKLCENGKMAWFMNNGQLPFLLYASRKFPDRKMESTEKRN
jgi:hypothetical protein